MGHVVLCLLLQVFFFPNVSYVVEWLPSSVVLLDEREVSKISY